MNELKPCPFCGKKDLFLYKDPIPTDRQPDLCSGFIYCDECGANGPVWTSSNPDYLKEDVYKAWNKRILNDN